MQRTYHKQYTMSYTIGKLCALLHSFNSVVDSNHVIFDHTVMYTFLSIHQLWWNISTSVFTVSLIRRVLLTS